MESTPRPRASTTKRETLYEYIPRLTPAFAAPVHLAPIVDALEQAKAAARGEADPVFVCTSVPPQWAKTSTYQHALAQWIGEQPQDFLGYFSYNLSQALDKSRGIRDLAKSDGVDLKEDTKAVELWRTTKGGGLLAQGMDGSITGKSALKCLVIDDPHKNRVAAESRVMRDRVWSEFRSSLWTRLHETTSVFVNHTRWHVDDLIGRIKADPELSRIFRFVNVPVVLSGCDPKDGDDFEWLWPEAKSKDLVKRLRAVSDHDWWSLYMGEPRPRETQVFRGTSLYTELPSHYQVAIGVDLAYSSKKTSDYSIAVVLAKSGERYFVLDVVRRQCSAPQFAQDLERLAKRYVGAPMHAYLSGTESGAADFMRAEGIPLTVTSASADKYTRALPISAAWNAGQVAVPDTGPPWLEPFLGVLLDFTGQSDPHDDDVDALAAAFDALSASSGVYLPPGYERPQTPPRASAQLYGRKPRFSRKSGF